MFVQAWNVLNMTSLVKFEESPHDLPDHVSLRPENLREAMLTELGALKKSMRSERDSLQHKYESMEAALIVANCSVNDWLATEMFIICFVVACRLVQSKRP